ncbi:MAG: FHA domain-containing protein [Acidobacteria bacterium]|nr:FHA domain-containing protein [Acidobacteriota bacterium]MBV9070122.1 FHA domain-containing protein [Acidobacteriota bacterium]
MSFVIQRSSGRGLALTQVRTNLLRIGRGTNAELRSENPAVALEHAVIEGDANGFTITDKGSITGTYVNRRPVETTRLARGDVIEIGDLRIEVQVLEPGKPLFVRVSSTSSSAGPILGDEDEDEAATPIAPGQRGGTLRAPKVDYADIFRLKRPGITKLSMIAILLILALLIVNEITKPEKQSAFMPGGVSSAHTRAKDANGESIAKNCSACHNPWRGVSDAGCKQCHGKLPHAENEKAAPSCADCHSEHRGVAKLAAAADRTCVSCHGNILDHVTDQAKSRRPDVLSILSFGTKHPEFTPRNDPDTLLFNHKLHLAAGGVFNGEGRREVLRCTGCHKLVETKDKVDPSPVTFRNSCQRCHKLTFDPRFPDTEVPHGGDSGIVYGFVLATYAGNRDIAGKSPEEIRRILTSRPPVNPDQRAVLNIEQVIKTKCSKCHILIKSKGRIAATPPEIPTRWFFTSKFTHTPHRNLSCEACHETARQSVNTSDVLMPSRRNCTGCHGGQSAKTSSSCATCHGYHERSKVLTMQMAPSFRRGTPRAVTVFGGGSRMIESVLLWAIVLLLLVVLVPVGLAFYQRIRAKTREDAADRTSLSPRVSTTKIPALKSTDTPPAPRPAPPPAPAPAPQNPVDVTRQAPVPSEPEGAGTEMVEWYGMLQCTSGALEGQHFIIEKDGIYIGRDPAMSQVAIADNRISKRHLRIVPRDGKVVAIDQNSTNGTFLGKAGGERITEVQLRRNDVLVLADNAATFVYQI